MHHRNYAISNGTRASSSPGARPSRFWHKCNYGRNNMSHPAWEKKGVALKKEVSQSNMSSFYQDVDALETVFQGVIVCYKPTEVSICLGVRIYTRHHFWFTWTVPWVIVGIEPLPYFLISRNCTYPAFTLSQNRNDVVSLLNSMRQSLKSELWSLTIWLGLLLLLLHAIHQLQLRHLLNQGDLLLLAHSEHGWKWLRLSKVCEPMEL